MFKLKNAIARPLFTLFQKSLTADFFSFLHLISPPHHINTQIWKLNFSLQLSSYPLNITYFQGLNSLSLILFSCSQSNPS